MTRRLLSFLVLAFATLPLLGAIVPLPAPVVVVYPLTVTGVNDPEAGATIAVLLSTKMAEAGGVIVKPYTPGTDRAHYLDAAKAIGADYYVTGFITPLGDQVSMLAQVVSTYSGTVVFSTTALVRTYAEAGNQAETLHGAILRHAGRGLGAYDAPPPAPSSSPAPAVSERPNEGGFALFKHKKAAAPATPAPSPAASAGLVASATAAPPLPASPLPVPPTAAPVRASVTPAPVRAAATPAPVRATGTPAPVRATPSATPAPRIASAPRRDALVVAVNGEGESAEHAHVAGQLVTSLQRRGQHAALAPADLAALDPINHAAQMCGDSANVLYLATLSIGRNDTGGATSVRLDVVGYDCNGNPVIREHSENAISGRGGMNAALDRATESVAAALARSGHAASLIPKGLPAAT